MINRKLFLITLLAITIFSYSLYSFNDASRDNFVQVESCLKQSDGYEWLIKLAASLRDENSEEALIQDVVYIHSFFSYIKSQENSDQLFAQMFQSVCQVHITHPDDFPLSSITWFVLRHFAQESEEYADKIADIFSSMMNNSEYDEDILKDFRTILVSNGRAFAQAMQAAMSSIDSPYQHVQFVALELLEALIKRGHASQEVLEVAQRMLASKDINLVAMSLEIFITFAEQGKFLEEALVVAVNSGDSWKQALEKEFKQVFKNFSFDIASWQASLQARLFSALFKHGKGFSEAKVLYEEWSKSTNENLVVEGRALAMQCCFTLMSSNNIEMQKQGINYIYDFINCYLNPQITEAITLPAVGEVIVA